MPTLALMVTGHRPSKIGGYRPCQLHGDIQAALVRILRTGRQAGFSITAISGMALGVDQLYVEAALETQTPFHAYVPFHGQERLWPASSQARYRDLLRQAAQVVVTGQAAESKSAIVEALHTRNLRMVEACQAGIAVWDGTPGGTANAVGHLRGLSRPVLRLDPRNLTLTTTQLEQFWAQTAQGHR